MAEHRLLVVEDDTSTRDVLRGYYSRMGWQVSEAGTVAEALALLNSEPEPCCLILDLMLPDGDGTAVLKEVRAKGLKTRVAVCTGTVDLARLKAVAELRPDAMLPKPIQLPEVWTHPCGVCGELN
jgi:two-component system OmpR family response regulator